jgi:hypothetical protein
MINFCIQIFMGAFFALSAAHFGIVSSRLPPVVLRMVSNDSAKPETL